MQIILLSAVIMASIALLIASHRIGHKLFMGVSIAAGVSAAVLLALVVFNPGRGIEPMDTDALTVQLDSVHATETGYRVVGSIYNGSALPLAETDLAVTRSCAAEPCDSATTLTLLLHVPAGADYPFSQMVDIEPQELPDVSWQLTITGARAYRHHD